MVPLRIESELAWLDSCDRCEVLWVEKLDDAVIERLERKKAVKDAVESLRPEDRRAIAHDVTRELADSERQLRLLKAIRELLYALAQPW
jgi:hypothetical protein